jgi:PIN domain nuclease of toxin-antitoxin system
VIYACDTRVLVWFLARERRKLSRAALRVLDRVESGQGEMRVSVISLHEVARLLERNRARAVGNWAGWLERAQSAPGLTFEPVTVADVDAARELPMVADPFDRIVAGMALRLEVPLITADEEMRESGLVEVVW